MIELKEAARALHIPEKQLETDILQLAFHAEVILEESDSPSRKLANATVMGMLTMYLRGHGLRMGSRKSFLQNIPIAATLATSVWEKIIGDNARYPCFHKLGYTSIEKLIWRLRKSHATVIDEAEEILEKKGL